MVKALFHPLWLQADAFLLFLLVFSRPSVLSCPGLPAYSAGGASHVCRCMSPRLTAVVTQVPIRYFILCLLYILCETQ